MKSIQRAVARPLIWTSVAVALGLTSVTVLAAKGGNKPPTISISEVEVIFDDTLKGSDYPDCQKITGQLEANDLIQIRGSNFPDQDNDDLDCVFRRT